MAHSLTSHDKKGMVEFTIKASHDNTDQEAKKARVRGQTITSKCLPLGTRFSHPRTTNSAIRWETSIQDLNMCGELEF